MLQGDTRIIKRSRKRVKEIIKKIIRLTLEDLKWMVMDKLTRLLHESPQIRQTLMEYYGPNRQDYMNLIKNYMPITITHLCLLQYGVWMGITEPIAHWRQELENFYKRMTPQNLNGVSGAEGRRAAVLQVLESSGYDFSNQDYVLKIVSKKFEAELGENINKETLNYVCQYIAEDIYPFILESIIDYDEESFWRIVYSLSGEAYENN